MKGASKVVAWTKIKAIRTGGVFAIALGTAVSVPFWAHAQGTNTWQQRFEGVYKLKDGEVLRYIPRPFIPERMTYYTTEKILASQAKAVPTGPDTLMFRQDDKDQLHYAGVGFGRSAGLFRWVLTPRKSGFRRFRNFEFQDDSNLLKVDLPGDWTIRDGTSRESFLAALEPIVYQATKRQIHFEKQMVERDVLVARGKNKAEDESLKIYAEKQDRGGADSGDLQDLLSGLGDDLGIYIVDETLAGRGVKWFEWEICADAYFSKMGARRAELTEKVLQHFSKDTGITFTRERRAVPVWVITEKK